MSGPLASWTSHHSKAGPVGRAVLTQIALTCNHDGSPSEYVPTWADLEHRTGYSRRAVAKGLREVLDLAELAAVGRGGGRGNPTPHRVNVALCDPPESCWACRTLLDPRLNGAPGAPFSGSGEGRKGAPDARKGARGARKGAPGAPTTDNGGTAPTLGGAVPPRESDDRATLRSTASGSASRSAASQPDCEHEVGEPCRNLCRHGACARDCGTCHHTRREALA